MRKGIEVTPEEGDRMFREICTFAIWGLCEPDKLVKQFYLERILITCGLSLAEIRSRLDTEQGVAPSNIENVLSGLEIGQ